MTTTILGAYFAIFLTDIVAISPGVVAAAIFIGRSWDYLNDPLIGHISDRTRTRWGRRRPFLLFGALPFALAFSMGIFLFTWVSIDILQASLLPLSSMLSSANLKAT